ncbi:MAG: hypothetical protein Kow0037_15790 [Calditrichia bacterium]
MRNINVVFLVFLLLISLIGTGQAFEKVGTTSFQFLKVITEARSTAMGEAYVAVASGADAIYYNPAGLTRVQKLDATLSYLDYFLDVRHSAFAAAYNLGLWGVIGVHGLVTDVGEIEVTRVENLGFIGEVYNPGLTGETISPSSMVFGISYARNMTDKFAFGLTAKYAREDLVMESEGAVIFDMGLNYRTGFRSLNIGASLRNFGREIKFIDEGYPLPQTMSVGIAGYLIGNGEHLLAASENQNLLISFELVQPRDYDQQYNLGIEYGFHNNAFIRFGYKFNYDEESFTGGFGLSWKNYRLDYSYCDFGEYLDSLHRFTFGFRLQ